MGDILDGKARAGEVRERVKAEVSEITAAGRRPPGLVTILVGEDPASKVYVGRKQRLCKEAGMHSESAELPADVSAAELKATIERYNADEQIDGILVQLPLPSHLNSDEIIAGIDPAKDVDGLHPVNQGALVAGTPKMIPCTPAGCMDLLDSMCAELSGKRAVVVGRSVLVGKPIALLLLQRHATVTICHSRTTDLADEIGRADIVVAAVGVPEMIRGEWVKPGAIVIDVGINRVDGKLIGDVEFKAAAKRAGHITPVPGGVGPMTVAMLLSNTVKAYRGRNV